MRDAHFLAEQLIEHASSLIISSVDPEGFPNIKAMLSPRVRDGLKVLYFTTNTSSRRVQQYTLTPKPACMPWTTARLQA